MTYTESIKNKQPQKALDHFTKELQYFITEESEIVKKLERCPKENREQKKCLILDYHNKWVDFTAKPPFPDCSTYISEKHPEDNLCLTNLYGRGYRKQCKFNGRFVEAIIQYVTYLYYKNNLFYQELIIWNTLLNVEKAFNLLVVIITPKKVVDMIRKYIEELDSNAPAKPQTTYFMNECYDNKLTSSAKGAMAIHKVLEKVIGHYLIDFNENFHRYPTRAEIKEYITEYCKKSENAHLQKWNESINDKTLFKITYRYRALITRKKKGMVQYTCMHKPINLNDTRNNLTENEKLIYK